MMKKSVAVISALLFLLLSVSVDAVCEGGTPNGAFEPPTEGCDDGNTDNCDGCSDICILECGNEVTECSEGCDNGGTCLNPAGFTISCTDNVPCDSSSPCTPQSCDGCDNQCQLECGNGVPECDEQCDGGSCQNGPCQQDCACPEGEEINQVLFKLYMGHNLLFFKVLDLAHISKDEVIQEETKGIQVGLTEAFFDPPNGKPCNVVPTGFMTPATLSPYGKENEIDQLNKLWLFTLKDPAVRDQLGVSDDQFTQSSFLQFIADFYLGLDIFINSGRAKCCAYNQLIVPDILSFDPVAGTCSPCGEQEGEPCENCGDGIVQPPEECDPPNIPFCGPGFGGIPCCDENCIDPFCGDGILSPGLGEQCDPGVPGAPCPGGAPCSSSCECPRPPGGGGNPQVQVPGCADGSEYDLLDAVKRNPLSFVGKDWYYIDNGGNKHELNARKVILVGPTCCADCCSSYCSILNPRWLCLPPVIYNDENEPFMIEAQAVCRPAVLPMDAKKCLDLGGLHCLRREMPAPTTGAAQTPVASEPGPVELAECVNSEDCTPGFICQNGACVREQVAAESPKVVAGKSLGDLIAIGGILVVILAAILFVMLHRRPRAPSEPEESVVKPAEKLFARPVEKPVEKPVPMPVKEEKEGEEYDSAKINADLDDLEKSYKKIEDVLKSMRGKV